MPVIAAAAAVIGPLELHPLAECKADKAEQKKQAADP